MPDQHKPGPATDALVAERVMRWHHEYHLSQTHAEDWRLDGQRVAGPSWSPSTDIAAAWEVHQKMRTRIFSVRQRYYWAIQCVVRQRLNMAGQPLWPDVFGVLKPEDICLAAIAVVESEANG